MKVPRSHLAQWEENTFTFVSFDTMRTPFIPVDRIFVPSVLRVKSISSNFWTVAIANFEKRWSISRLVALSNFLKTVVKLLMTKQRDYTAFVIPLASREQIEIIKILLEILVVALHEEFLQRNACKRGRPSTGKVFVPARCNIGREYLSSLIKGDRQVESIFIPLVEIERDAYSRFES